MNYCDCKCHEGASDPCDCCNKKGELNHIAIIDSIRANLAKVYKDEPQEVTLLQARLAEAEKKPSWEQIGKMSEEIAALKKERDMWERRTEESDEECVQRKGRYLRRIADVEKRERDLAHAHALKRLVDVGTTHEKHDCPLDDTCSCVIAKIVNDSIAAFDAVHKKRTINYSEWLLSLKPGDKVERRIAGTVKITLKVSSVVKDRVVCGLWEFSLKTGGEIDEDLGWDGVTTGSQIFPTDS